jgi:hypothetical protein
MVLVPDNHFVSVPVAVVVQPRADDQPGAEGNIESSWRRGRLHIDHFRLIHRHVDDLRSGGDDFDDPLVNHDGLLWRGEQIA